ncbi:MAG TPA: MGMT family protein [bacterium]|nr:MGMT family protein [bacterium]HPR87540.1 MGMT family protein [bacterium]
MESIFQNIRELVAKIPPGRVATYGQIAAILGIPGGARTVGWAMHGLPEGSEVPWHRVIGAGGQVRLPEFEGKAVQVMLLRQEGVDVDGRGRIDLEKFQWVPE